VNIFFYKKENKNHELSTGFSVHKRFISAVKEARIFMPYIILRGHWCDTIALNVQAPVEDKTDDTKDSLHEELECIFNNFPKYQMKILVGDFIAEVS
jgi:hypothetical protein